MTLLYIYLALAFAVSLLMIVMYVKATAESRAKSSPYISAVLIVLTGIMWPVLMIILLSNSFKDQGGN